MALEVKASVDPLLDGLSQTLTEGDAYGGGDQPPLLEVRQVLHHL